MEGGGEAGIVMGKYWAGGRGEVVALKVGAISRGL